MKKLLLILILSLTSGTAFATDYCALAKGCWRFTEGSGTSVADGSGNTNTGTFKSSGHPAWYNTSLPKTYTSWGANFAAAQGDYITCTTNNSLSITGNITILYWIYANAAVVGGVVERFSGTDPYPGYAVLLYRSGNDVGKFSFYDGGGWHNNINNTAIGTFVQWDHFAITGSSTTGTVYKNGVSDGTFIYTAPGANTSDTLYMGSINGSGGFYLQGVLTEVAVFDSALNQTQINDIMDNGLIYTSASPASSTRLIIVD